MKKLLILLSSTLLLTLLVGCSGKSDESEKYISDYKIEGMSIGDNLLDYMNEKDILKIMEQTKNHYSYLDEPYKYADVYSFKKYNTYESIAFAIRNNVNKDYKILSIRGLIPYTQNLDACMQKRDIIAADFSEMFPNAETVVWKRANPLDPSGNSIFYLVTMVLSNGDEVKIHCSNWDETFRLKNKMSEGLSIELSSKEVVSWLAGYENSIQ